MDNAAYSDLEMPVTRNKISFMMPNGVRIVAELSGYAMGSDDPWASIDLYAEFSNGRIQTLCVADFETKEGNLQGWDRFRVMLYKQNEDDPSVVFTPMPHRSIWLSLDEGSYDINVWDEDSDTRDEPMEIGHIATLMEAEWKMEDLIVNNPQIIWTKRDLQIK